MSRPRGNRRSRRAIERKKEKVIAIMEENNLPPVASQTVADAAGIGRKTLHRYLKSLDTATAPNNSATYNELKANVLARIAEQMDRLEAGTTAPDVANAWKGLVAEFSKIAGLNAPTRSIHASVSGPQLDALYLDIRAELIDLDDGAKQDALLMMRAFAKERKQPVKITAFMLGEGK